MFKRRKQDFENEMEMRQQDEWMHQHQYCIIGAENTAQSKCTYPWHSSSRTLGLVPIISSLFGSVGALEVGAVEEGASVGDSEVGG